LNGKTHQLQDEAGEESEYMDQGLVEDMAEIQVSVETHMGEKSAEKESILEKDAEIQVCVEADIRKGARERTANQEGSVGKESIPEEILKEMEDVGLSKQEVISLFSEMELIDENENCWEGEIAEGYDKIATERTLMEVVSDFQEMMMKCLYKSRRD
jgi:hypothetical protein